MSVHAIDSERYVLGAVLWHRDAIAEVSDVLKAEHFFDTNNSVWWVGILDLYERGLEIDVPTLQENCRKRAGWTTAENGMRAYDLSQIYMGGLGMVNIMHHALIVAQCFIQRETAKIGAEAVQSGEDYTEDAFELAERIAKRTETLMDSIAPKRAESFADAEADEMAKMDLPKKALHSTGYKSLDRIIGGYQRGDLVIVAARPAMGKSAYAFSSASLGADQGHPTGFFSLELNKSKGQARLTSIKTGVPLAAIVRGEASGSQVQRRHESLSNAKEWPLWVRYDTAVTLSDIRAEATRMVRKHKVGCIFIDQLNWITPPKSANRDNEVGAITRGLKQMALQLDIAVVLLHQLNRAVETRGGDKRPKLSDLRDSGNVEQDAQVVMFLYRPEYYGITEDQIGSTIDLVEVIVAKNSNGPTDTARLAFAKETAQIKEGSDYYEAPHPDNHHDAKAPF